MFRRQIALAISLVLCVTAVVLLWMMPTSEAEHQALAELVGAASEVPSGGRAVSQHRIALRRDIVEGASDRKVLFAADADLYFDFETKNLVETYRQPSGYTVQLAGDNPSQQIVHRFRAEQATYCHHEKKVEGDTVHFVSSRLPIEVSPEASFANEALFEGTAAHAHACWEEKLHASAHEVTGTLRHSGMTFSCAHLTYNGSEVTLQDEVVIHTPQATIKAAQCVLRQSVEGDSVQSIALQGDVVMTLADGSTLASDRAVIDPVSGVALFTMESSERVRWEQSPLQLWAKRLQINFTPGQLDMRSSAFKPETIQAEDDVEIVQAGAWTVRGDLARMKVGAGLTECVLKKATVDYPGVGRLDNDQLITIQFDPAQSRPTVTQIHMHGTTLCTLVARDQEEKQSLRTHGPVVIDHQAHTARFDGLKGSTCDPQVVMTTEGGELRSNHLVISYADADEERLTVTSAEASGNVCLRGAFNRLSSSSVTQFAVCDTLTHWPAEQRTLLASMPGRVALVDISNGLAVSAPAIELRRDSQTQKDVIRGLGDVRFSLLDREYQRLKERFGRDLLEIPQKKR
jgi:hypothetical protein